MPVQVTIGLSRKLSKNYNSQGFSINVDAELPASAIDDPSQIAERADYLFRLANDILDQQTEKDAPDRPSSNKRISFGHTNGNGRSTRTDRYNNDPRRMTSAQHRALTRMARKVGSDAEKISHEEFGIALSDLDIKQASSLIDSLKNEIESSSSNGNR